VTFPANELARVSTVKSAGANLETPRDFERFLREQGFSRSRAKAITAKGFASPEAGSISQMVANIEYKRQRLLCETKNLSKIGLSLNRHWSSWKRSGAINPSTGFCRY